MSDVAIVGAGPVGLFLALALHRRGLRPVLLEKRTGPRGQSRSVGVHPPSLEKLDRLGLGERFVERGVRVRRGVAYAGKARIGELGFDACRPPHRYVLTVPQPVTESILREAVEARMPEAIVRGAEVREVTPGPASVRLGYRVDGAARTLEAPFVVACDGKRSACREAVGIGFDGRPYPGAYLMCDAPDTTELGDRAAISLAAEGLVESFPLPGGTRRWVARRASTDRRGSLVELVRAVEARTGWRIPAAEAHGFSEFVAERHLAGALYRSRVALAGDAAHVVSPIGGQGLNLGWLGAWTLADALAEALARGDDRALERDAKRRTRTARTATRRAELNMWLGRPRRRATPRPLVRALLTRPIADGLARLFTMRALEAPL